MPDLKNAEAPAARRTLAAERAGNRSRGGGRVGHLVGSYGLLGLAVLLAVVFSIALPDTFPTTANLTAVLSNQSIPAMLALGATIPIVTGRFDLSIGYGLGLSHVVVMYLLVQHGWPWPAAAAAVIVGGALVGVANGVVVEFAQIDSFIATLGTGSVLYAITGWITGGARIVPTGAGLPAGFTDLYNSKFLGLPVSAFYVLALGIVLWLVLEHLPIGRSLYVIGSNKRAADLLGIPSRRYVVYAYAASGMVTGAAGVLLAAQQQIGDPSIGMDYLLPAFSAALLGSTAIKLGRVNAMGTLVAVLILAIGLSGLGQFGAQFWATPLFNGATLLAAVGLAGWSARRRIRAGAKAGQSAARAVPDESEAEPATPAAS